MKKPDGAKKQVIVKEVRTLAARMVEVKVGVYEAEVVANTVIAPVVLSSTYFIFDKLSCLCLTAQRTIIFYSSWMLWD